MSINLQNNRKVSIITPVYNSEKYLDQTIQSVIDQTYLEWELWLVDDCSTDHSLEIIQRYSIADQRIHCLCLSQNSGAAKARNEALKHSTGRYIAYLDADDLWLPSKLEKQLAFMQNKKAVFTCCDYEKIEADGTRLYKRVRMPKRITYEQLLSNTIIQTVGVMVDLNGVERRLLMMPDIRRGQDSATWLQMLKNGVPFQGQNEVLACYRRVPQSLSSNKWNAVKRTWYLYRSVEQLPYWKSIICIVGWAYHATIKRIYVPNLFRIYPRQQGEANE